jgi:hypothetical protein
MGPGLTALSDIVVNRLAEMSMKVIALYVMSSHWLEINEHTDLE